MREKPSSFSWLLSDHGIDFESLDPQLQAIVRQLDRKGVEALVEQNKDSRSYRGGRVSRQEEIDLAEAIARLVDTSTHMRFVGPGSRKVNNGPDLWVNEEYNDLADPDRD